MACCEGEMKSRLLVYCVFWYMIDTYIYYICAGSCGEVKTLASFQHVSCEHSTCVARAKGQKGRHGCMAIIV
jgi:hypothetical protein